MGGGSLVDVGWSGGASGVFRVLSVGCAEAAERRWSLAGASGDAGQRASEARTGNGRGGDSGGRGHDSERSGLREDQATGERSYNAAPRGDVASAARHLRARMEGAEPRREARVAVMAHPEGRRQADALDDLLAGCGGEIHRDGGESAGRDVRHASAGDYGRTDRRKRAAGEYADVGGGGELSSSVFPSLTQPSPRFPPPPASPT